MLEEAILHERIDSHPLVNLYTWIRFIHLLTYLLHSETHSQMGVIEGR